MKSTFLLIILCAHVLTVNGQTSVPGGSVAGTWALAGSPYLVQGSIMIPDNSTLTVQPGVTVIFQGHYKLLVLGRLLAIGNATDSIIFTSANTATGWYGFRFENTPLNNDTSKLVFCSIQWGKANGSSNDALGGAFLFSNFSKVIVSQSLICNNSADDRGGAIYLDNSNATITYCNISNNNAGTGGAIFLNNSNSLIAYNNISHNSSTQYGGGAIICSTSSPTISDNIITYNAASTGAGAIYCTNSPCHPVIINNIISHNSALGYNTGGIDLGPGSTADILNNIISYNTAFMNGGGINCFSNSSPPLIANNTIVNNSAMLGGGIHMNGNADIINNVIANNSASIEGGGIACVNANNTLMNNTIVNNSTAGNGGGLYCNTSSSPAFLNCIFYGNTAASGAQVYLSDEQSDPNFYYNDIQGGTAAFDVNGNFYTGIYLNNIDTNPLFVSPTTGSGTSYNGANADWSLQSLSPCINSGSPSGTYPLTDIVGNPRVAGSYIDMGAYEYQGSIGISDSDLESQFIIYPMPFHDFTTIQLKKSIDFCELNIFNLFGQKIKTIISNSKSQIKIERGNLRSGMYIYELKTADKYFSKGILTIID